jgi:hypothetical protein
MQNSQAERDADIAERVTAGEARKSIANRYGLSGERVRQIARAQGVEPPRTYETARPKRVAGPPRFRYRFNPDELRRRRIKADLTRLELADACGCSVNAIGYYESGRSIPGTFVFVGLCEALDCDPIDLLIRNPGRSVRVWR